MSVIRLVLEDSQCLLIQAPYLVITPAASASAIAYSPDEPGVKDSKPISSTKETPLAASNRSSPTAPHLLMQVQIQAAQASVQAQAPPLLSEKKKNKEKQKSEPVVDQQPEFQAEQAPPPVTKEAPIVIETKVLDDAAQGRCQDYYYGWAQGGPVSELAGLRPIHNTVPGAAPTATSDKKKKAKTLNSDKGDISGTTEVKLKELLSALSGLTLSEAEAVSVMTLLCEKSPSALDTFQKDHHEWLQRFEWATAESSAAQSSCASRKFEHSQTAVPSIELLRALSDKEEEVADLQRELDEVKDSLEHQRKNNNELREKNWCAMDALSATESMLERKLDTAVKDNEKALVECRNILTRLKPNVPVPIVQDHHEWLQRFERAAAAQSSSSSEEFEHSQTAMSSPELLRALSEKEKKVAGLQFDLAELEDSLEHQRKKNNELREKNWCAMDALSATESMLERKLDTAVKDKEKALAECRHVLNTFLPDVPVDSEQHSQTVIASPELLRALSEKEEEVAGLQFELAELKDSLEHQRKKNNELREKNWCAMDALSATESMLERELDTAVKDNEKALAECRHVLTRLLPSVPVPSVQDHHEWLQRFEEAAAETSAAQSTPASGEFETLAEKLKESEETQRVLQKDCETYKKVLAETEGILQRLQRSVEQEESRWKVKLELTQGELKEMSQKVTTLEQEIERLTDGAELENLTREKQHLESELDKMLYANSTYVMEVKEVKGLLSELQTRLDGSYLEAIRQNEELNLLKTQLTETLSKLKTEENERQKVAGDLYKAQQSLDLIQGELSKVTDSSDDLIENSSLTSQREEIDRKEKMTAGLNQTVRELQQLLRAVSLQLAKGQEQEQEADKNLPMV